MLKTEFFKISHNHFLRLFAAYKNNGCCFGNMDFSLIEWKSKLWESDMGALTSDKCTQKVTQKNNRRALEKTWEKLFMLRHRSNAEKINRIHATLNKFQRYWCFSTFKLHFLKIITNYDAKLHSINFAIIYFRKK